MPTIMETIAAHNRLVVEEEKKLISPAEMEARARALPADTGFPFEAALSGEDIAFICECKKASPSKGLIAPDFPDVEIAKSYEAAGAAAISVLTEPKWFLGSTRYLTEISSAVKIPCLRKDFVIDDYQIFHAKALGASAVLLICAITEPEVLARRIALCRSLGLTALVEAHDAGSGQKENAGRAAGDRTMTKIKLCGLSRPEDIEAANSLGADYIGFMFYPKSKRFVDLAAAESLRPLVKAGVTVVGVFVNEAPETVAGHLNSGLLDLAQLHGQEDEAYIARLRALTDKPLIQAFKIASPEDAARAVRSTADYILLDNGAGGTGQSFDWSLITDIRRPYFLAGGLNPGNVSAALAATRPFAVDVSSGIETGGKKDADKMRAFVTAVKEFSPV